MPASLPGHFVTPYRMAGKGGKNDANDAAAICEAADRPHMRFVPVKTPTQQPLLAIHRLREGYKEDRTACINRIRGLLTEFGIVFAQSPEALRQGLADVLEDASNELPGIARLALQEARLHWIELECHIPSCDERITAHVRSDAQAKAAAQLSGIGPVTASALVAKVGDFKQFKNGARVRLVAGAGAPAERVGWQKAAVALANKNARIVWALLARGRTFDPDYVSVKPGDLPAMPATAAA